MMTTRDLAWAAGFLEGEGCFLWIAQRNRGRSVTTGYANVTASQVDPGPIRKLVTLFGGWSGQQGPYKSMHGVRPIWKWRLGGKRAVALMLTIYGLMESSARRAQIRKALDRWKAAPGIGSWERAKTHCPHGHEYAIHVWLDRRGFRHCRVCIAKAAKMPRRVCMVCERTIHSVKFGACRQCREAVEAAS